jgi:hypothetical protein
MQLLPYPTITPSVATVDLTEVNAKIEALRVDNADDATKNAIAAAPDLTPYAKTADVDAKNAVQDAAIASTSNTTT